MTIDLLIIVLSLILSAFFSGMEIAYVSSNKIHIEIEKKQGGLLSKLLTKITAKPSKFIATMLIGNNIALVIYGFYMGDMLVDWFASYLPSSSPIINSLFTELSLLTQTVISTLVILRLDKDSCRCLCKRRQGCSYKHPPTDIHTAARPSAKSGTACWSRLRWGRPAHTFGH